MHCSIFDQFSVYTPLGDPKMHERKGIFDVSLRLKDRGKTHPNISVSLQLMLLQCSGRNQGSLGNSQECYQADSHKIHDTLLGTVLNGALEMKLLSHLLRDRQQRHSLSIIWEIELQVKYLTNGDERILSFKRLP